MTPDHTLRLQTMLRSMLDTVIPAIDPGQRLALDQAQIIAGNMRLLLEQCDKAYLYEMTELREYVALLDALADDAAGGAETTQCAAQARELLARCEPIAQLNIPAQSELAATVRDLKGATDALLRAAAADGTGDFSRSAAARVMAQSGRQVLRERAWFRASGFELEPEKLPDVATLLQP